MSVSFPPHAFDILRTPRVHAKEELTFGMTEDSDPVGREAFSDFPAYPNAHHVDY